MTIYVAVHYGFDSTDIGMISTEKRLVETFIADPNSVPMLWKPDRRNTAYWHITEVEDGERFPSL